MMPKRMAEKMHRLKHIGSNANRRTGRYIDRRMVCDTERSNFSMGAIHCSSPVSCRSFCAFRLRILGIVSKPLLVTLSRHTLGDMFQEQETRSKLGENRSKLGEHRMTIAYG